MRVIICAIRGQDIKQLAHIIFYKSPCNKRIVIIRINAMANGEVRCNDLMIDLFKVARCSFHLLSSVIYLEHLLKQIYIYIYI